MLMSSILHYCLSNFLLFFFFSYNLLLLETPPLAADEMLHSLCSRSYSRQLSLSLRHSSADLGSQPLPLDRQYRCNPKHWVVVCSAYLSRNLDQPRRCRCRQSGRVTWVGYGSVCCTGRQLHSPSHCSAQFQHQRNARFTPVHLHQRSEKHA